MKNQLKMHEIKLLTEFDFIVWLIYDNDFYDLNVEKNQII